MPRFLECCCTTLREIEEANEGGASRVELCAHLEIGGVTPDIALIEAALKEVPDMKLNVLIRPRGGNFVYDDAEIERMRESIRACKKLGVNGVVTGVLKRDGSVDVETMRVLIGEARPMEVTFHRAFDVCADPLKAFEDIMVMGCDRLLTSGHNENALNGSPMIAKLVEMAQGRITVMPGCGVRTSNIAEIEKVTNAPEYHSSAHGKDGFTDRSVVAELVDDTR